MVRGSFIDYVAVAHPTTAFWFYDRAGWDAASKAGKSKLLQQCLNLIYKTMIQLGRVEWIDKHDYYSSTVVSEHRAPNTSSLALANEKSRRVHIAPSVVWVVTTKHKVILLYHKLRVQPGKNMLAEEPLLTARIGCNDLDATHAKVPPHAVNITTKAYEDQKKTKDQTDLQ